MASNGDGQLSLLFEYTKFHIGAYITLVGVLLTALLKLDASSLPTPTRFCFLIGVACFMIAGCGGGAIASNIPNFASFSQFSSVKLEVFGFESLSYEQWAHIEHGAFWAGSIALVLGVGLTF